MEMQQLARNDIAAVSVRVRAISGSAIRLVESWARLDADGASRRGRSKLGTRFPRRPSLAKRRRRDTSYGTQAFGKPKLLIVVNDSLLRSRLRTCSSLSTSRPRSRSASIDTQICPTEPPTPRYERSKVATHIRSPTSITPILSNQIRAQRSRQPLHFLTLLQILLRQGVATARA